ncbi:hypothetical protein J3459_012163 [Metarhizium acridum]|uniref:uncharacterized protein n=1 Tax=Metarhizium acridum TaxID=92637 RepID=UPI001C6C61C4|nr:hypothetical protein J3458_021251 [Metarhizium acridum]KAG8418642.1 hypothetical protein J3459_012163 [Metarhizium acridum]
MHVSATSLVTLALAGQALSRAADKVCTAASATTLLWRITGFEYRDERVAIASSQVNYGLANFTLQNSALSHKTTCTGLSTRSPNFFTGDTAYDCAVLPDDKGDLSSFTFDRATGLLRINQTWVCERDGSRFGGQGHVKLDLKCGENQSVSNSPLGGNYSDRAVVCDKVDVPVNITYLEGTV